MDGRYIAPLVDLNVSHDDDDGDARAIVDAVPGAFVAR
jgi:hypothetical protein